MKLDNASGWRWLKSLPTIPTCSNWQQLNAIECLLDSKMPRASALAAVDSTNVLEHQKLQSIDFGFPFLPPQMPHKPAQGFNMLNTQVPTRLSWLDFLAVSSGFYFQMLLIKKHNHHWPWFHVVEAWNPHITSQLLSGESLCQQSGR